MGDRFNDQIVEDVMADIVDEVEAMMIWGGVDGDVVGNAQMDSTESGAVGGSEVLKGGVGAAFESAGSTGGNSTPTTGATVGAGHTAFEDAGTPNVEASDVKVEDTAVDQDVDMS